MAEKPITKGDIRIVKGEVETLPELPDFLKEKPKRFRDIYKVLKQLLDTQRINQLFRDFHAMVGVPVALLDLEANVLASSSWMRICTDFHRANADTCARCIESDTELANQLEHGSQFTIYRCKNGMTDCASPIVIEGQHVANLFVGQFLLEQPDRDFFRKQAEEFGFPVDDYLAALDEAPVIDEERIPAIMDFLVHFAEMVASMGLEQLHEQQMTLSARFGRIVENSLNEVFIFDSKSLKFILVNHGARTNLGYSMDELSGLTPIDIKPEFTLETFEQAIRPLRENEMEILVFETVHQRKDGSLYDVEVHLQLMHDETPPVFVAIIQDITERKRSEQALRESERNQQWLLSNLPAAVVVHDAASIIQYCNEAALKILGLTMRQALGKDAFDPGWHFIRDDGSTMPFEEFPANKVISTKQPIRNLSLGVIQRADEEPVWVLVDAFPDIDTEGELKQVVVTFIDVTERRRMEKLMVQTEKMMSVGGLAAGMAHELNNPLGGILQGIQNVQRRLSPGLEKNRSIATDNGIELDKLQAYLEKRGINDFLHGMAESGERAADIVKNMLMFSRKTELRKHDESLNEIAEKALTLAAVDYDLKKKYEFRDITIQREYDESMPPASCIASDIQQVLLNLFRNAAQALADYDTSPEPPTITVRTFKQGGMACIEVSDNGPGIDETINQRVFEPFFTTREVGEGTGLGLSVSYFIVTDEHGGVLTMESEPGRGTKFLIKLPL